MKIGNLGLFTGRFHFANLFYSIIFIQTKVYIYTWLRDQSYPVALRGQAGGCRILLNSTWKGNVINLSGKMTYDGDEDEASNLHLGKVITFVKKVRLV